MAESKIEWTDATWNPIAGCTKCSPGCLNCYAEKMAYRLKMMGKSKYFRVVDTYRGEHLWTNKVVCDESVLDKPLHWRKPRKIFPCSMSDLFHPKVPREFIDKVMAVIALCPQHIFQILTKRAKRMKEYFAWRNDRHVEPVRKVFYGGETSQCGDKLTEAMQDIIEQFDLRRCDYSLLGSIKHKTRNVCLGVTVCTQKEVDEKIPILLQIPAVIRYVSLEPMLEGIHIYNYLHTNHIYKNINYRGLGTGHISGKCKLCDKYIDTKTSSEEEIKKPCTYPRLDWVIVGAESGPKRRPCKIEWIQNIVDQCKAANVPCFVKQINVNGKLVKMPEQYPQETPK